MQDGEEEGVTRASSRSHQLSRGRDEAHGHRWGGCEAERSNRTKALLENIALKRSQAAAATGKENMHYASRSGSNQPSYAELEDFDDNEADDVTVAPVKPSAQQPAPIPKRRLKKLNSNAPLVKPSARAIIELADSDDGTEETAARTPSANSNEADALLDSLQSLTIARHERASHSAKQEDTHSSSRPEHSALSQDRHDTSVDTTINLTEDSPTGATASVSSEGVDLELPNPRGGPAFVVPKDVASGLFAHQREGLRWLWDLHLRAPGGILGDDMGLGKTRQIAAFLRGLMHGKHAKRALLVAPTTLLAHWEKELETCGLGRSTYQYYGSSADGRDYALRKILKSGGILLTTYGMVLHNAGGLAGEGYGGGEDEFIDDGDACGKGKIWDYVILDEGHKIKNHKAQTSVRMREIPAKHRLILSGTPIQNNLLEMWALYDFCCPGLLGDDTKAFKALYEKAIMAGRDKNASARQRHVGSATEKQLRERIQPFFLRREKKDVFGDGQVAETGTSASNPGIKGKKKDLIVWLRLTPQQKRLYMAFLNSEHVAAVLDEPKNALSAITILKKICDHPALMTRRAAEDIAEGAEGEWEDAAEVVAEANSADVDAGTDSSCKTAFVALLLEELRRQGHRTLLFSQSRKMLDIVQADLEAKRVSFLRIDGSIAKDERQARVDQFQTDPSVSVFLLTSQVGGLGLTLTAASRVIIIDPAWNPSTDDQSVDRAYRMGQTQDVVVYRLISCGSVEEKIYCKQVFKGGLMRAATRTAADTRDLHRYFSLHELQDLFRAAPEGFQTSATHAQLHKLHAAEGSTSDELREHIDTLKRYGAAAVSQHDLVYSKDQDPSEQAREDPAQYRERDTRTTAGGVGSARRKKWGGADTAAGPWLGGQTDMAGQPVPWQSALQDAGFPGTSSSSPGEAAAKAKVAHLEQQLARQQLLLNCNIQLPDGGAKIRARILDIQAELNSLQNEDEGTNADALTDQLSSMTLKATDSKVASPMQPVSDRSTPAANLDNNTNPTPTPAKDRLSSILTDLSAFPVDYATPLSASAAASSRPSLVSTCSTDRLSVGTSVGSPEF
eukprot:jgi/Chlat1/4317/Chrsp29S04475